MTLHEAAENLCRLVRQFGALQPGPGALLPEVALALNDLQAATTRTTAPGRRARAIEAAAVRMLCGVTAQSANGCDWYEGIEHDAAEELRAALALPDEPLRVLVTVSGGVGIVDYCPEGVTVEVRDFDNVNADGSPGAYEVGPPLYQEDVRLIPCDGDPDTRGDWRRADNARPEFDGPAPGTCGACGLRDATPGRADGMCSECFAAQASE